MDGHNATEVHTSVVFKWYIVYIFLPQWKRESLAFNKDGSRFVEKHSALSTNMSPKSLNEAVI